MGGLLRTYQLGWSSKYVNRCSVTVACCPVPGQGTTQRYCCMEPEPWIPSSGLFDGKAGNLVRFTTFRSFEGRKRMKWNELSNISRWFQLFFKLFTTLNWENDPSWRYNMFQPPILCPVQPCIPASMGDEICGQKGFADVQLDGAVYIFVEVFCFDIIIFLPRKRCTCKIWTLEIWSCFTLQADFPLRYEKFKGSTVGELWAAVKSAATGIDPTVRESRRLRVATVDWTPMAHRGDRGNDVVWRDVVIAVEQEDKVSLVTISGRKKIDSEN